MNFLRTSYSTLALCRPASSTVSHLDRANIGILCDILVLVESILRRLALSQIDRKFDEKEHNWLEGCDRAASGSLRGDMFVQDSKRSLGLAHCNEFLCSLSIAVSMMCRYTAGAEQWEIP